MQPLQEAPEQDNYSSTNNLGRAVRFLPLFMIEDDPDNERDDLHAGLEDLVAMLQAKGQLEAIIVYAIGPRSYRILSGHRRRAAAKQLGWTEMLVMVVDPPADEEERAILRLMANARQDIDPIRKAQTFQTLIEKGWTQERLELELSISQSLISKSIALLHLPFEVRALVSARHLSPSHAHELLRIEPRLHYHSDAIESKDVVQLEFAKDVAEKGSTVKALREAVGFHLTRNREIRQFAEREEAKRLTRLEENVNAAALRQSEQARREAEHQCREKRREVAAAALMELLDWRPEDGATVEHLRIVAVWFLDKSFLPQITVADELTLLNLLAQGAMSRLASHIHYDGCSLAGWPEEETAWLEGRYGCSQAITTALQAAGLIAGGELAPNEDISPIEELEEIVQLEEYGSAHPDDAVVEIHET